MSDSALEAVYRELRREYLVDVPARLAELQAAIELLAHGASEREVADLRVLLHRLKGSAGSYGFPEASAVAREAEGILNRQPPPGPSDAPRLLELVARLRAVFDLAGERVAVEAAEANDVAPGSWEARLVLPEIPLREQLALALGAVGFKVVSSEPLRRTEMRVAPGACGVVVFSPLTNPGSDLPARTARVLIGAESPLERSRAIATGYDDAFTLEEAPEALVRYGRTLANMGGPPPTVLHVTTAPVEGATIEEALRSAGVRVLTVGGTAAAEATLAEEPCNLVLLGPGVVEAEARTFAHHLRAALRTTLLPVVIVAPDAGAAERIRALRAGADDLLPWPLDVGLLLQTVVSRAARSRQLESLAHRDPLTGCLQPTLFRSELAYAVAQARRHQQHCALVSVSFTPEHMVEAAFEPAIVAAAEILRSALRGTDLVTRNGYARFVLLLRGAGPEQAAMVATRVMRAMAAGKARLATAFSARPAVAIAVYPADGDDADQLMGRFG